MHAKSITSVVPAVAGTDSVAVVALFEEKYKVVFPAAVVWSFALQLQPFGAVSPVAPFIVIMTEHVFAPRVNFPEVAPPVVEETEQPDVVNLVPALWMLAKRALPPVPAAVPALISTTPAAALYMVVSIVPLESVVLDQEYPLDERTVHPTKLSPHPNTPVSLWNCLPLKFRPALMSLLVLPELSIFPSPVLVSPPAIVLLPPHSFSTPALAVQVTAFAFVRLVAPPTAPLAGVYPLGGTYCALTAKNARIPNAAINVNRFIWLNYSPLKDRCYQADAANVSTSLAAVVPTTVQLFVAVAL